jgi:ABC-2 type transport system permease protein
MSKIWLITRREYLTRVRNKTFLLSTFLFPLVIMLFFAGMILVATQTRTHYRVAVVDGNGYFKDYLKSDSSIVFDFSPGIDTLNYSQRGATAVLIIPPLPEDSVTIYRLKFKKQLGPTAVDDLRNRVNNAITDHFIYEKTSVSRIQLDTLRTKSRIAVLRAFDDNDKTAKASNQNAASAIGYVCAILIYILTFVYGAMVMRGVMEEKTSRIAEVVVSSVKPFQLMMGKITGIGAVGLTQFLLWIILVGGVVLLIPAFMSPSLQRDLMTLQQANAMGNAANMANVSEQSRKVFEVTSALSGANLGLTIFCFLFYFIGGYLFYSALFAAIGSAVNEDPQEAQSLMMPVTLPIVFSFFIASVALQDPTGSLAVWASIIPFSSPIVMMGRIPFGVPGTVPWWQLGLSMVSLVLGFLGTVWLAGKIYRTGILMYGKKATWKTMWRWAFRKS